MIKRFESFNEIPNYFEGFYEYDNKVYQYWFLKNKEYSREEWIDKLKKIRSKHYDEQKMLFDMEKYNL